MDIQGIPVTITKNIGDFKLGRDASGKGWMTKMKVSQGTIKGLDGDGRRTVKAWIGPNLESQMSYRIEQAGADGEHDEEKLVLGFNDPVEAATAIMAHYPAGKHPVRSIHQLPVGGLEDWVADGECWAETAHCHHGRPHEHGGIMAFFEGKRLPAEKVEREEEMAKAEHEPMQDGDKWITIHPNGKGSKGNAVLIRPIKGEPGVHRIVSGAGGSLNFMRINLTKSPEDYKKESLERRKTKMADQKAKMAAMTPEERETHAAAEAVNKENTKKAEKKFITKVLGDDSQEGQDVDMFQDGPDADPKAAKLYHKERLRQAFAACKEAEKRIVLDADSRIASGLAQIGGGATPGIAIDSIITTPSDKGPGYDRAISSRAEENGLTKDKLLAASAEWKEAHGLAPSPVPITDPSAPKNEEATQAAIQTHVATKQLQEAKAAATREAVNQALENSHGLGDMLKARAELRGAYKAATAARTGRTFLPGYLVTTSEPTPEEKEALVSDLTDKILRSHVSDFLDEVERDNPAGEALHGAWNGKEEEGMAAARGGAAWGALHEAGLAIFGQGILDRDTVETLGAEAAAQVMGKAIRDKYNPTEQKTILDALKNQHVQEQMVNIPKATEEAQRLRSEAADMKDQMIATPRDFSAAAEMHRTRIAALKQAQGVLGAELGRHEARAALIASLQSTPAKDLQVPLGRTSPERAMQAAAAMGLMPGAYTLDHAAGEAVLTIPSQHQDALIRPVDSAEVAKRELAIAFKRGDLDTEGYVPAGFAKRPKQRYENQLQDPPVFQRKVELPEGAGEEHLGEALKRYIGQRWSDGHRAVDISSDIRGAGIRDEIPSHLHSAMDSIVDKLVPTHELVRDADGEPIQAMHDGKPVFDTSGKPVFNTKMREPKQISASIEALGKGYLKAGGDANLTLEGQEVDADHPDFHEAVHRVLAEDPRLQAAHAQIGELTDVQQAGIRDWFYKEHHGAEGNHLAKALEAMGPEPPKFDETTGGMGLFEEMGQMESPAWVDYQNQKKALIEKHSPDGSPWAAYIQAMGGLKQATEAIQGEMKGKFANAFHGHYGRLTGSNLQIGTSDIAHYSSHLKATSGPEEAAKLEADRKAKQAKMQKQGGGQFKSGSVKEKMDQAGQAALFSQGASLFGSEELGGETPKEAPVWEKPETAPGERHTLGGRLEAQIGAIMPTASEPFQSKSFNPVKIAEGMSMNGRFAPQQRGIKAATELERIGLFYGAGSGKTAVMMGATSELVTSGKAKKFMMAVPSIVQGQFGSEAINFLDPSSGIKIHAKPGATFDERLAAYRDPGVHATVVTHQGLRDDSIKMLATHLGKTEDEASSWAMSATPEDLKGALKGAFAQHGASFDGLMIDEGHDALNRKGKPDSLLAKIIDAHGHNSRFYVGATGSPVKNDSSEAFDWLHKIDPTKYPKEGRDEFLRRYGNDNPSNRRALKSELSRYFFAERVHPGVGAHHKDQSIQLDADQHAAVTMIEKASAKLRIGEDPVKWAKILAPKQFEGQPQEAEAEIADRVKKAVGTFKETAMNRAVNIGGAKATAAIAHVKDRLAEGKPCVVFAHNLESVQALHKMLTDQGIPATALTGKDSSSDKAAKLATFQGANHSVDVIVMSDAGATGANLQRGKTLIHMDQPMTAKTHEQRTARIHRLGQTEDVEVVNMLADHEWDRKARERVQKKAVLADVYQSKEGYLDDSGLAEELRAIRSRKTQAEEAA